MEAFSKYSVARTSGRGPRRPREREREGWLYRITTTPYATRKETSTDQFYGGICATDEAVGFNHVGLGPLHVPAAQNIGLLWTPAFYAFWFGEMRLATGPIRYDGALLLVLLVLLPRR